jgi:anhydro-N-acetylmuramic acid kinase
MPVERVILTGGGVRNGFLWRLLAERLAPAPIERSDGHGLPAEAKSAVDAAVLAALTLDGQPANVPAATGAGGARLLGRLTPGSPANWARCLHWMTSGRDPQDEE